MPPAEDSAALAARITDTPQVMAVGDGVARAIVLGAPMRLDHRQVGSLLVGTEHPAGPDGIGMSVLETVANQLVTALRNAWLFEHGEDLRRQAMAGRAEAERHAEELASRNEQLRRARGQLARARQAELVSAERHRIARELHDGVAQCLVGIGMHLEWCHRHLDPASAAYQRLVASKELARAGLGQVRSAVAELSELERPGEGLGEALRDLAGNFRSTGPLRVSVRVGGPQRQLAPEVEHALFQIAQEGLWNVVRHAGAAQAWLNLQYRTGQTRLSISDNGQGDPAVARRHLAGAAPRGRFGLRIMAERAGELGGEVTVQRRRRGGLRIEARIPDQDPGPGPACRAPVGGAGPGPSGAGPGRACVKRAAASAVRILIVDDHTIVRQGLRSILDLEPDFTVVGEAADAATAVTETARLRPDVVLLDLKLSDSAPAEGLDVCARLLDGQPQVSIVVLTTFLDQKLLVGALQRGASGYALKDVDAVELGRIIRTVHRGESGFDGRSARLVVRSLTGQPAAPARLLSERELEVVRLVARGATNVQAARDLYVSESTIKYHLRLAMRKLGAKDRTELVYRASAQGLL